MKTSPIIFFFLLIILFPTLSAQEEPDCFRIYLADKAESIYTIDNPHAFLSQRAIAKRTRFQIPITIEDLPVNQNYKDTILSISPDISIIATSKWLNTITLFYPDPVELEQIASFSFVDSIVPVGSISHLELNKTLNAKLGLNKGCSFIPAKNSEYGFAETQICMHNGHLLHEQGYRGEGILIAVLDAGWLGFDTISFFENLYRNGQILGVRDLDPFHENVYTGHQHGTNVTAVMAANSPDFIVGTAPESSYFLIRSEVNWTEQHFEEDLMVMGFELADSLGADVINASLGYTDFSDYPFQRWSTQQSDGRQSVSSRAASLLASKGIIHVNSAGNNGNDDWLYIARPADATDILSVGALYPDSLRAEFSSFGYSADGRVKPDVAALGINVATISMYGDLAFYNGTSLAAPIITGLTACLWQALPHKSPVEIMQLIRENSHLYHHPNAELGYGIPNFALILSSISVSETRDIRFTNPIRTHLGVENYNFDMKKIHIYDLQGKLIYSDDSVQDDYLLINAINWESGVYIGVATLGSHSRKSFKIVKI